MPGQHTDPVGHALSSGPREQLRWPLPAGLPPGGAVRPPQSEHQTVPSLEEGQEDQGPGRGGCLNCVYPVFVCVFVYVCDCRVMYVRNVYVLFIQVFSWISCVNVSSSIRLYDVCSLILCQNITISSCDPCFIIFFTVFTGVSINWKHLNIMQYYLTTPQPPKWPLNSLWHTSYLLLIWSFRWTFF